MNAAVGVATRPHITCQTSCKRANKIFAGVSLTSIMNSFQYWLLLWVWAVNCYMCKSNEYPVTVKAVTVTAIDSREIRGSVTPASVNLFSEHIEQENDYLHKHVNDSKNVLSKNSFKNMTIKSVTGDCLTHCNLEATDFLNEYGLICESKTDNGMCFQSRCIKGCEKWNEGLANSETCQEICISTQLQSLDLPCITACEMGRRRYWNWQKQLVEPIIQLKKPYIELLNNTDSLMLFWNIELPEYFVSYYKFSILIQFQCEGDNTSHSQTWRNLANYNCNQTFVCELFDELLPFAVHKFRFKLDVDDIGRQVLYSPATEPFRTLPKGIPLSPPLIREVTALDHSHISIIWEPGAYACGALQGYVLTLENSNFTLKQNLDPHKQSFIFAQLLPSTSYSIKLAMFNANGEGPSVETFIKTNDAPIYKSSDNVDFVVVTGEYSIKIKPLEALMDAELLFESEHLINDYALYTFYGERILFIIDALGKIIRVTLEPENQRDVIPTLDKFTEFKPKKITVDWLNKRILIAGQTLHEQWAIISTDFNGNNHNVIYRNLTTPIDILDADPINGWLFSIQNDSIVRTNLANNNSEFIVEGNVGHFSINFQAYLITYNNKSDNEFYESTYDGHYIQNLQLKLSNGIERVQRFWYNGVHMLATNGTHLVRKNYLANEFDIWTVKELEWCSSVLPITQKGQKALIQMQPVQLKSPTNLNALVTSNMAKITWNHPKLNAYQTEYAWQKWDYELEIMDIASNTAFNIRNIKTTHFYVEKLQPNNLYEFRVRIGVGGILGCWSKALLTRTWPYGEYKFLLATTNGVYEMNETGEHVVQVGQMENVQGFVQLNTTIYYISKDNRLECANIMNSEINCSFIATNAMSLAYEWRSGKMYWIDILRNCVMRANLDGSQRELLPIFGAQSIAVDAYNGHIYYSTGVRLVRRSLGDTLDTEEYEYYHVSTYDDVIRGFALDVVGKRLFWVVRKSYDVVHSFRVNTDIATYDLQYNVIENDIKMGSLKYLYEIDSLLWLSANSNAIILSRTSNSTNEVQIKPPKINSINYISLKSGYMAPKDILVTPEAVDAKSVRIIQAFTDEWIVKWAPINSSENFTIFYNILLEQDNNKDSIFKTNESFIKVDEKQTQKSNLSLSITPYTYWSFGPTTRLQLQAPVTNVAPPKRVRVFVQHLNDPTEANENISAIVRWDAPENKSSFTEVTYKIYCYQRDKLHAEKVYNSSNEAIYQTTIDGLHIGDSYTFQVQSFVSGVPKGGQRTSLQIQVNPDLHTKPGFLYVTSEFIAEFDLDLDTHNIILQTSSQVEHLAAIPNEKRILWVNENVELFSLTAGLQPIKLARMRAEVLSLTVDWIQRTVYWAELEKEYGYVVSIYELDLCHFEGKVMTPNKLFSLNKGKTLKDLIILPFSNILLWLEFDTYAPSSLLMGRNMRNSSFVSFKNTTFHKMFVASLMPELETVSLIDDNGNTCIYDIQRRLCHFRSDLIVGNISSINNIDRDNSFIYVLRNETVSAFNARKKILNYQVNITDIKNIKAYNYQHYPPRKCLLPDRNVLLSKAELLNPQVVDVGENYVAVMLPSINEIEGCDLKIPGVKYTLWISDNDKLSRSHTTLQSHLNVTELRSFTNYTIQLTISTYYQRKLKMEEYYSELINLRTTIGTPSVPRNFTAYPISPSQIYVMWDTPEQLNCEKVFYKLHWQEKSADAGSHKRLNTLNFLLTNLEPSQEYTIWLEVFSKENKFNTTTLVMIKTFEIPTRLWLAKKTAYNFTLSWVTSPNVTRAVLACQEVNGENEFSIDITQNTSVIIVPDLEPKTKYAFVLEIFYGTPLDPYIWPELPNEHFIYETLGDSPGRPGQPQIEQTVGDVFRIFWEAAPSNGEQIAEYSLEALQARISKRIKRSQSAYNDYMNNSIASYTQTLWAEEPTPIEDKWLVVCNTTEQSCIIREIYIQRLLMFRVRARNKLYGWGPYSLDSERISEPFVSPEKRDSLVLAIITPAAIVSSFVFILIILRTIHIRRQKSKKSLDKSRPSLWSNISTLQHQQLIASRTRAFSTISHSTLYTGGPLSDADIALLPHINWSQIKILNFLGSGAFGEVYEGLIKHENYDQMEKVAIKSLRKGASEFTELLQEAQLMSNFKHENIVRLIGVCFDRESISIIMEHMEGGDLLCYLRNARPNSKRSVATLELLDLISMCIDVCKGCSYLEDMHFVHRDLACRNCLVSSYDPSKRMVKIGDFGLARDIYKSDYYRKEGEGLLPVRWMSPESLIDGVFTTQADVWAFAVLCWEIFTLGQQPYAARNNFEVLNYVKNGGRLNKPDSCPDQLFDLLLRCWSSDPEDRPSFGKCLSQLLEIKTELRRNNLDLTGDNVDYILYANQPKTCLSTFQMHNILPIVLEQNDSKGKGTTGNANLSEHLETFYQDVEIETISDNSQLIEALTEKDTSITSYNINEGISRL